MRGCQLVMNLYPMRMPFADGQSKFMEFFNTATPSSDVVDDLKHARNKKLKKSTEKGPSRFRGTMKGGIAQCIESFTEVAKSLIETKKETNPFDGLRHSIKIEVDILNNA